MIRIFDIDNKLNGIIIENLKEDDVFDYLEDEGLFAIKYDNNGIPVQRSLPHERAWSTYVVPHPRVKCGGCKKEFILSRDYLLENKSSNCPIADKETGKICGVPFFLYDFKELQ